MTKGGVRESSGRTASPPVARAAHPTYQKGDSHHNA